MPTQTPLTRYLRLQRALDQDVLAMLRVTNASVVAELTRLQGRVGIGAAIRADQLRFSLIAIERDMARYWEAVGDQIQATQHLAAAAAAEATMDRTLLRSVFSAADSDYLIRSAQASAQQSLQVAMERISGSSHIPLAESVYNNAALSSGKIDELVNAALARGASAAELAKDVSGYINPNVPGGVRSASMRLGRSELNNAFHASSARQAQKNPWTTGMKWNLSGSHPIPDECNVYAEEEHYEGGEQGVFRPSEIPAKPHPNCLCFCTTVDVDRDEFIRQFESGKYDPYLDDLDLPEEAIEDALGTASKITTSGSKVTKSDVYSDHTPRVSPGVDETAIRNQYRDLARNRQGGLYGPKVGDGLTSYQGYGYTNINDYLRKGASSNATAAKAAIRSIDNDFKKMSSIMPEDVTTYRGMRAYDDLLDLEEGGFLVDPGYVSSTLDWNIGERFATKTTDGWLFKIIIPKGQRAILPDHASEEREFILPRNTKFKVVRVDNDTHTIVLEVTK